MRGGEAVKRGRGEAVKRGRGETGKGLRRAEMKRGGWFGEASAGVTEGEHCGKREALKER